MAMLDMDDKGRWSPTDWPGGGEGAPADDRVAGGEPTPDELLHQMSEIASQWFPGPTFDMEALRGLFDRSHSDINDDDDDGDDDNDNDNDNDNDENHGGQGHGDHNADGKHSAGSGELPGGSAGNDGVTNEAMSPTWQMHGREVNTPNNLGVAWIGRSETGPSQLSLDGFKIQPGGSDTRADHTVETTGDRSLGHDPETVTDGSPLPQQSGVHGAVSEALGLDNFDLNAILAASIERAGRFRDIGFELRDGMQADHSTPPDQSRGKVDVIVDTRSSVPLQDVAIAPSHHQDDFRFI